ncbi:MAG: fibronectin type III domain-containing protein [Verrucomicrobiales bacterium]|nr:fibronectin type III domain-containing protein [Verrucomicrobiales bacterium]
MYGSQTIVLGWNPSPDTRAVGYFVYLEDLAGNPISRSDVGANTTATISDLTEGNSYVFYVSAYGYDTYLDDTYPLESEPSNIITYQVPHSAIVSGRHLFYNQSQFDDNDAAPNASDDAALAIDKSALLPGNTATFANYSSYSRGINGIMLDISDLPGTPTAADFVFKVGNDNTPSAWVSAPLPTSVTVRPAVGVGGPSRITLIWADNVIQKQWIEVTVRATPATGLPSDDVFYFGNAMGESGNSVSDAKVNATDEILTRNNPRSNGQAPIDFPSDFNRDGKVNATDQIIARSNFTSSISALKLIQVP